MNYVSAVYGVLGLIICIDWFARGRREYRSQTDRREAAEENLRKASIGGSESRGM